MACLLIGVPSGCQLGPDSGLPSDEPGIRGKADDFFDPSRGVAADPPLPASCVRPGDPCDDCGGEMPLCTEDAGGASYCTHACEVDTDCPMVAPYCAVDRRGQQVCQRLIDTSSAACGRSAPAGQPGGPCGEGCAEGECVTVSVDSDERRLCTRVCSHDRDCGPNAFCGTLTGVEGRRCVPQPCACIAGADAVPVAAMDPALAAAGHRRCEFGHETEDMRGHYGRALSDDPFRLTTFNRLYYAPMSIPPFVEEQSERAAAAMASGRAASALLRQAAERWDVDPSVPSEHLPPASTSFAQAILRLEAPLEGDLAQAHLEQIERDATDLPPELQRALVPVLDALRNAAALRELALACAELDAEGRARLFANPAGHFYAKAPDAYVGEPIDLGTESDERLFRRSLAYRYLAAAAVHLAEAVEAAELERFRGSGAYAFDYPTPLGRIVIGGQGDDLYAADDPSLAGDLLFVLDVGGDDRYEVQIGANASIDNPVSLAVDLEGSDVYTYRGVVDREDRAPRMTSDADGRAAGPHAVSLSERGRQGSGRLGVGLLFDLGGQSDQYASLRFSQGSGLVGVGLLFDDGGDDRYQSEAGSQGAAHFGMGLLIDRGGDDTYSGYSAVQGSAFVHGVGMLVDGGGRDSYRVQPGDRYVPSAAWTDEDDPIYRWGNSQGAAWGRRGDHPVDGIRNGVHSSGGFGALIDLDGDDTYRCGSFCQGSGYWFGVGMLSDRAGNDRYDGRIYHVGAAVHMGLGIFVDASGDDVYGAIRDDRGLSLGFAHDFSIGWHQDGGGNDVYDGAWQSFGTGSNQSFGMFANLGDGDDVYRSNHFLGYGMVTGIAREAGDRRLRRRTAGLFFDAGGRDSYSRPSYFTPDPIDESTWWEHPQMETTYGPNGEPLGEPLSPMPRAFSIGVDR